MDGQRKGTQQRKLGRSPRGEQSFKKKGERRQMVSDKVMITGAYYFEKLSWESKEC